jgi:serine-type D-Ala-D-Ala carboxypeptidase (penicillin-binding protein 5/6)
MNFFKIFIAFFAVFPSLHAALDIQIAAESAILINAETGKILYQKNSAKVLFPASLTKIATCIYVLEKCGGQFGQKICASAEALRTVSPQQKKCNNYEKYPSYWLESDTSHVGLKVGEELSLQDLLYALMLPSGGDAANVIAEYFGGGSIPRFMDELNLYLLRLGLTKTHFCNPSGLHHPDHVTTAQDMAILSLYAMKNSVFREIVSTCRYEKGATNMQHATIFTQCNKLLLKGPYHYPPAIGIKTGWHSKSKHNLASCAEKEGRRLIAVLLSCPERKELFQDTKRLFEKAFSQKKAEKRFLMRGSQEYALKIRGAKKAVTSYLKEDLDYSYYPQEEPSFRLFLEWDKHLLLPIEKNQQVGVIKLFCDDIFVKELPLFSQERVEMSFLAFCAMVLVQGAQSKVFYLIALCLTAIGAIAFGLKARRSPG